MENIRNKILNNQFLLHSQIRYNLNLIILHCNILISAHTESKMSKKYVIFILVAKIVLITSVQMNIVRLKNLHSKWVPFYIFSIATGNIRRYLYLTMNIYLDINCVHIKLLNWLKYVIKNVISIACLDFSKMYWYIFTKTIREGLHKTNPFE